MVKKENRTAYTFMIVLSGAIIGGLMTNFPTELWQKGVLFLLALIFIAVAEKKWG
jgi:hypothetical protein